MSTNTTSNEKGTWKSDELRELERAMQEIWRKNKTYQTNTDLSNHDKFFATFPYPYMNGELHLGHAFTMSKYDSICKFYRSMGKDVLQPFSFHLTGMPIVAAADKLREDIKILEASSEKDSSKILPESSQYNIMKRMGIPENEIINFTNYQYWGEYFPKKAQKTLERFAISYDSRRSFITTDCNPFYDKFVKWQFKQLYKKSVLQFGTRYDLFSVKNNQPCLGHERSSGEDAVPQKSFLILF